MIKDDRKVRCNECMEVFDEDEIVIEGDDVEHCPYCGCDYALMDMGE